MKVGLETTDCFRLFLILQRLFDKPLNIKYSNYVDFWSVYTV